jgi:glycosyltransferase involved in cell wall biosynthesis
MGAELKDHHNREPAADGSGVAQQWVVISRLIQERRIDELLRQVARLASEGRDVALTVIGDGPERQTLETLASRLSLDVRFLGAIYDSDVTAEMLSASDICLSPGHVGLAAVHALSCGCPVATHGDAFAQMPEFEAIREGRTGTLFPRDDFVTMADQAWAFVDDHHAADVSRWCHQEVRDRWSARGHWTRIRSALLCEPEAVSAGPTLGQVPAP